MQRREDVLSKVPEVTLGFWIIKILATTRGETGGNSVTMSWLHADQNANNGGDLIGTTLFLAVFVVAVIAQISTRRFNAWIYWLAIVASTTVGTAMADFFDRSLGVGYTGGSSILLACVLASLAAWYFTLGSIDVQTVATPKVEIFYWVTITFSQTLGTALGDWTADSTGLGYDGGALVFGVGAFARAACRCQACACVGRGAHEFARPLPRPSVQRVREICSSRSLMPWLVRPIERLRSTNGTIKGLLIIGSGVTAADAPHQRSGFLRT